MSAPLKSGKSIGSEQMTAEGSFVGMYMDSLQEYRGIWLHPRTDGSLDHRAFMMQHRYLINAIPDKNKREQIRAKQRRVKEELRQDVDFMKDQGDFLEFHAAIEVVSDVVEFLCSAFQLTHSDIFGPATSRQFKDNMIIIPDMPTDNPEVSDAAPAVQ